MVPLVGLRHLPGLIRNAVLGLALILAVAMVLAPMALAQDVPLHVFENEGVTLHLYAAPCDNAEAKAYAGHPRSPIKDVVGNLKRADSSWPVRTPFGVVTAPYAGCWVEFTFRGEQGYVVVYEDREMLFYKLSDFKKTKGAIGT